MSGCNLGQAAVVSGLEHERDDVRGLLDAADHAVGAERLRRVDVCLKIEPRLLGDQLGGEQPVDLVPGGADLRRDRVTEHLPDGAEQVAADDGVLLGSDPEGDVLVAMRFITSRRRGLLGR